VRSDLMGPAWNDAWAILLSHQPVGRNSLSNLEVLVDIGMRRA
jgi:hypothetical protein